MRVRTVRVGWLIAAALAAGHAATAAAQVTIQQEPERASLMYSANAEQDCSALHTIIDPSGLPLHVVRLRAVSPAGADKWIWALPSPEVGFLLADEDLGPQDETAAVRGLCGEFGNACILTKESLRFYNKDTILYAAPTCDVLPAKTSKPYAGGTVRFKVAVKAGRKKLGKATTEVRYGDPAVASVTLYAFGDDGIGKNAAIGFIDTELNGAPALPGLPSAAIEGYDFEWVNARKSADTCPADPALACVELGDAPTAGTFLATVRARLGDGSALCDALNVQVGACPRKAEVQVIRTPSRRTYTSGDTVGLTVRFANLSPRRPGCGLGLRGSNVLTCDATFRLGKVEETKTTRWDLQHCSASTDVPCTLDAQCPPTEACLTESHCSQTLDRPCDGDSDCREPLCPSGTCQPEETCVRVLAVPELEVAPGEAVTLVDEEVELRNQIPDPVGIRETWTAHAVPATSAETAIKYRIKGQ